MNSEKNLTLDGISGKNFLFIMNAVAMIVTSIYLTSHFYEVLFPTTLGGASSLCNISNIFNCDAATYSKLSNIAGVPISFFGIIVGLLFLFTSLMPSESLEITASAISKYNFLGCIILFIFSVGVLGSLCPFCTLYYILSGIAAYLLWKDGINTWKPEMKTASFWGIVLIIGSIIMYQTTEGKASVSSKLNSNIVSQFNALPNLGEPDVESDYKIHMASKGWTEAPIRITVFSDFQCPFCKVVAEQIPQLIRRYPKSLNVQYMFFPLDAKCNSNMKNRFHQHACDAAMIAACDKNKFVTVHDDIFANQDQFDSGILNTIEKKHGLSGCLSSDDLKNKVIGSINQAAKYNIKSTPTIIVNGKKIEGTIPNTQFFAIFEEILKNK